MKNGRTIPAFIVRCSLFVRDAARAAAREAGSGSVSVRGEEKFGFSFWEAGEQARSAMCRRVGAPAAGAAGAKPDELTVGTPDRSGSVSLERR